MDEIAPDTLWIEDDRSSVRRACSSCASPFTVVTGFVHRGPDAHAIYKAALHVHDGEREAWIDVLFGSFGTDDPAPGDRVSFGCRVGPIPGQRGPQASLVAAAQPYDDAPLFGAKLTRDEALAHPSLQEFWAIVDHVLMHDPDVHFHVYAP